MTSDRSEETWSIKLFYGAVYLMAFSAPISSVATQVTAILVLFFGAWLYIRKYKRNSVSPWGTALILGLLAAFIISSIIAGINNSLPQLKKIWILLAFLPLAYFSSYYSKDKVLSLLIFGSALASLIETILFLSGHIERAATYSAGYITLALFDAALIPIALAYWLSYRKKRRHFYLAAIFLMAIGLIASQTRIGWLGAFIGIIILATRKEVMAVIIYSIYIFVLLAVIPGGLKKASGIVTSEAKKEITANKITIWSLGLSMVPDMPLFGYGSGCFDRLIPQKLLNNIGEPGTINWNSTPLEVLLESGYLGLAFLLGILGISLSSAWKRYKKLKDEKWVNFSLLAGIIVLYYAGLTMSIPQDAMLLALSVQLWAIIFIRPESPSLVE